MAHSNQDNKNLGLDLEWTILILEAQKMGISIQEIRAFLDQNRQETSIIPSA